MSSIDGSDHGSSDGDDGGASDKESVNGDCSEEEDISLNGDNGTTEDIEGDDNTSDVITKKHSKNQDKKNSVVKLPSRKIGPQKQKKEIHTYLKKARKFEIRKLTRRITTLRNLKGSDEQKAKNNRKVEKLLKEIQAMKEFMIDQITERIVDIFKGKSEQIYLDMWTAAQDHKEFEKMLQTLSNGSDVKKYENIAFLRMISSKDIICKLKMVNSGTNIKKPKSKKALQKQLRKYNQKNKKLRKLERGGTPSGKSEDTTSAVEITESVKDVKVSNPVKSEEKSKKRKSNLKKIKNVADPFFLPAGATVSIDDDDDDDTSSGEEFSAPVDENQILPKKKNRMGQRRRKQLVERQHVKSMTDKSKGRRGSLSRHLPNQHKKTKIPESSKTNNTDDKKLHPSWQAKQKLKAQQSITVFSGTKITFDD